MIKVWSWMIFKCVFSIFNNASFSSQKYFSIFWPFSCSKSFFFFNFDGQRRGKQLHLQSKISYRLIVSCFRNIFFDHFSFINSQPRHLLILGGRFFKCIKVDQQFNSIGKILKIHSTRTFFNVFMLFILF